jgi:ankyrin repeat protein
MATNQEFLNFLRSEDADPDSVKAWVEENNFDINANINLERTALHWFAYWGNGRVVGILLEAGAKVEGLTAKGLDISEPSALGAAIIFRDPSIVLMLLRAGANPNMTNQLEYRDTNLHQAVEARDMPSMAEIINLMLIKGADITARNSNGYTPFQLACLEGNIEAVRVIINYYPHININEHGGISILEAFQYSQPDLYAQLAGTVSMNNATIEETEQVMAGVDGLSIAVLPHGDMDTSS